MKLLQPDAPPSHLTAHLADLLPRDKSWLIRMGTLDMLAGQSQAGEFLARESDLGGDLMALQRALETWPTSKPINVGESGTLYRFLRFAAWKLQLPKTFIKAGTLPARSVCDDQNIVTWPQRKLLTLDSGTSQWASAAALLGDTERLPDAPFKLKVTYDAVDHWRSCQTSGKPWEARRDATIEAQAAAFLRVLHGEPLDFTPEQAEDYCFARAFGLIDAEEGERRWPSLRGHESDRIAEMETALREIRGRNPVSSCDHRVVQAIVMQQTAWGKSEAGAKNPGCVTKTWPQFWEFMVAATSR